MSDNTPEFERPLEQAEAQLRDIVQRQLSTAPVEAASLGRILAHVVNIRRSVAESPADHANAAKRLGDFAQTMERMAKRGPANDEEMVGRMSALADTLERARATLAR